MRLSHSLLILLGFFALFLSPSPAQAGCAGLFGSASKHSPAFWTGKQRVGELRQSDEWELDTLAEVDLALDALVGTLLLAETRKYEEQNVRNRLYVDVQKGNGIFSSRGSRVYSISSPQEYLARAEIENGEPTLLDITDNEGNPIQVTSNLMTSRFRFFTDSAPLQWDGRLVSIDFDGDDLTYIPFVRVTIQRVNDKWRFQVQSLWVSSPGVFQHESDWQIFREDIREHLTRRLVRDPIRTTGTDLRYIEAILGLEEHVRHQRGEIGMEGLNEERVRSALKLLEKGKIRAAAKKLRQVVETYPMSIGGVRVHFGNSQDIRLERARKIILSILKDYENAEEDSVSFQRRKKPKPTPMPVVSKR